MAKETAKNLIPNNKRTEEERRRNARNAGIASGKARRKKRDMKACFEMMMQMQAPEKVKKAFEKQGMETPENLTTYEALTFSMMMKALSGDSRMASLIMDVMGEKSSDKLKERELNLKEKEMQQGRQDAIERLDEILKGLKNAAENDKETE